MKQTGQIVQSEVLQSSGDCSSLSFSFLDAHCFLEEHSDGFIFCEQEFFLHTLFASSEKVAVSVRKTVNGISSMNASDLINWVA